MAGRLAAEFSDPGGDGPVKARLIQEPEPSPDGKQSGVLGPDEALHGRSAGRQAAAATSPAGRGASFHPSWSPDGKTLVYVSWASEGGHIWKRSADGTGEAQQLTPARRRFIAIRSGPRTASGSWPSGRRRRERNESPFDSATRSRPGLGAVAGRRPDGDQPGPWRESAPFRR